MISGPLNFAYPRKMKTRPFLNPSSTGQIEKTRNLKVLGTHTLRTEKVCFLGQFFELITNKYVSELKSQFLARFRAIQNSKISPIDNNLDFDDLKSAIKKFL